MVTSTCLCVASVFVSLFIFFFHFVVCLNFVQLVGICVVLGILKFRGLKVKEVF